MKGAWGQGWAKQKEGGATGTRAAQWPGASYWWPLASTGRSQGEGYHGHGREGPAMAGPFVSLPPAPVHEGWEGGVGARGTPCPHPLCPGPPALCGQNRDPSQGKLGGDGGHAAGDNGHQTWPVTQFPPDLRVTKEMFLRLGVTSIPQKHLLDTHCPNCADNFWHNPLYLVTPPHWVWGLLGGGQGTPKYRHQTLCLLPCIHSSGVACKHKHCSTRTPPVLHCTLSPLRFTHQTPTTSPQGYQDLAGPYQPLLSQYMQWVLPHPLSDKQRSARTTVDSPGGWGKQKGC